MKLEIESPCKVNLLLNVLGRRADGFHELETVLHPVKVFDTLRLERSSSGVALTCSEPSLPTDSRNLVARAATAFLEQAGIREGVRIRLEKRIPLSAGLGGGSGNAAAALRGLNELFGHPVPNERLGQIAETLGSDVPFFLQSKPSIALGRGERIQSLDSFPTLQGAAILLVHPGFGISTPWAYQQLARFPAALNGKPGRAQKLVDLLRTADLQTAASEFYNALEAPALAKYPLLALFQEYLREHGAVVSLMSGSGSTTFAIVRDQASAQVLLEKFRNRFGSTLWTKVVPL